MSFKSHNDRSSTLLSYPPSLPIYETTLTSLTALLKRLESDMSASDTLEVGLAFAQRALENQRNASRTENESLYHTAVTNYSRAIEMLSLTPISELDEPTKQLVHHKINTCQDRKAQLEEYLRGSMPAVTISDSPRMNGTPRGSHEQEAEHETLDNLFKRLNVSRDDGGPFPSLDDVVGLENAKDVIREATVFPKQFPELFKNRRVWKTILLYGPSGVGKTYITKAMASETECEYFCISAGELMGICERNCEGVIKELFACAKRSGNVMLCVEDVDMLFSGGMSNENERIGRVKAQILTELQRLQEGSDEVVLIAMSRSPWLLEEGFLSRMDRRVYAGLPDAKDRAMLLSALLGNVDHTLTKQDIENIARECETYSGADLRALVMDAKLEPLRVVQDSTHFRNVLVEKNGKDVRMMSPCSGDDDCAIEIRYAKIRKNLLCIPAVTYLDFEVACDRTRPTVGLDSIEKHLEFSRGRR